MTLDKDVAELARKLNASKGKPVLISNTFGGNGGPILFIIGEADYKRSQSITNVEGTRTISAAFLSVRNGNGNVYELAEGTFRQDEEVTWGRNYFPEQGGYVVVGQKDILEKLRQKGFQGELPKDVLRN